MKKLKIVAIGAGNLASHLLPHLHKKKCNIIQVYSRQVKNAKQLANQIGADPIDSFERMDQEADVYFLMVSDDAIKPIAKQLIKRVSQKAVILHSSGSKSSKLLKDISKHYGVLYPLQTFNKNASVVLSEVPVFTTGNSKFAKEVIDFLAKKISSKTIALSDKKRKELHLAAVVCNNFVHHLFAKSEAYLKKKRIPFEYLMPLIEKTVSNAKEGDLKNKQTGPARRNDTTTIKAHLEMLDEDPEFKKLYKTITKSIKDA